MVRETTTVGINKGIKKQLKELIERPDITFNSEKGFVDFYCLKGIEEERKKIKKE